MMAASGIDTLIILGAGGDLTSRLLLPGLASLLSSSRGQQLQLIGVDRGPMTDARWQSLVQKAFADLDLRPGRPGGEEVVLPAGRCDDRRRSDARHRRRNRPGRALFRATARHRGAGLRCAGRREAACWDRAGARKNRSAPIWRPLAP